MEGIICTSTNESVGLEKERSQANAGGMKEKKITESDCVKGKGYWDEIIINLDCKNALKTDLRWEIGKYGLFTNTTHCLHLYF